MVVVKVLPMGKPTQPPFKYKTTNTKECVYFPYQRRWLVFFITFIVITNSHKLSK